MINILKAFCALLLVFFMFGLGFSQVSNQRTLIEKYAGHLSVSIVELLSNPERYHGKRVLVQGYLHLGFEDSALYFSKEQADYGLTKDALWVSYKNDLSLTSMNSAKKGSKPDIHYFDCKYVILIGTFNKDKMGHLSLFSGTLEDVDSVTEMPRRNDGKKTLFKYK